MISVVVPTMWRYPPFLDFVKYIIKLDIIKEIIIINNNEEQTPDNYILCHHKIKMAKFGKNIYVNPAWNYGVNASQSEIVCIMNDDITFDIRLFYKIEEFFTDNVGVIGLSKGDTNLGQTPLTTGTIEFELFQDQNCHGFGELMFVRKKYWKNIPEGLDIGFGDNFIFEYLLFNGLQNYFIVNMFHHHAVSQTTNSLPESTRLEFYQREFDLYQEIKLKIIDKTLD